jgi:hypothetical protein
VLLVVVVVGASVVVGSAVELVVVVGSTVVVVGSTVELVVVVGSTVVLVVGGGTHVHSAEQVSPGVQVKAPVGEDASHGSPGSTTPLPQLPGAVVVVVLLVVVVVGGAVVVGVAVVGACAVVVVVAGGAVVVGVGAVVVVVVSFGPAQVPSAAQASDLL